MEYFGRKITRGYWDDDYLRRWPGYIGDIPLPPEPLSVWQCTDDEAIIEEVYLALATSPRAEHFERFDVIFFTDQELSAAGFVLQKTQGETCVPDLRSRHRDILVDEANIRQIGELIVAKVRSDNVRRVAKGKVIEIVQKAVDAKRFDIRALHENLQKKLRPPTK